MYVFIPIEKLINLPPLRMRRVHTNIHTDFSIWGFLLHALATYLNIVLNSHYVRIFNFEFSLFAKLEEARKCLGI